MNFKAIIPFLMGPTFNRNYLNNVMECHLLEATSIRLPLASKVVLE